MPLNSSLFLMEVKRFSSECDAVSSLGREARLLARAAAVRFSAESEVNGIAQKAAADLAQSTREWGKTLPVFLQPWLELFYTRYLMEREDQASRVARSALISRWRSLSISVRQQVLGAQARLGELVDGEFAGIGDPAERESRIRFVVEAADASLLPIALNGVSDEDSMVASAAEESLALAAASMVNANIRELGVRPEGGRELAFSRADIGWRAALHSGIAGLCERYQDHRRRGVLGAALALLDRGTMSFAGQSQGNPLARWLKGGSQESHPALRSMLRRNVGPLTRLRAWEWLTREPVKAAALERVAWADSTAEHEALLSASHLIENPARAAMAALILVQRATPSGPVPDVSVIPTMSVEARRGIARWVQGVRAEDEQREEWLAPILADPDATTRLSTVNALPGRAVIDYCFDADEGVATASTLKWSLQAGGSPTERARLFANLERSAHAGLRWVGTVERERALATGSEWARVAEWKELREDRAGMIGRLRALLRSGRPEQRLDAVQAAQRLGVQREVELEVLTLLSDSKEPTDGGKLIASLVNVLGGAGTDLALEAVRLCLNHPIARVRSNAVEALARAARGRGDLPFSCPRLYESMIEMKHEGSHRVRATALREVLSAASPQRGGTGYEPVAAEGLLEMLGDSRATHRLAALWAMERVASQQEVGGSLARRWDVLASRVAELTQDGEDEAVRRRAVRCARRMLACMRTEQHMEVAA